MALDEKDCGADHVTVIAPHGHKWYSTELAKDFYCMAELPERAGREGDTQRLPVKNNNPYVQDAVLLDIEARKQLGIKRYGTQLQINNGRDMLQDAYEEALDLAIYLKGAIMERDAS